MGKFKDWFKKKAGPNVAIAKGTAEAHHAAKYFNDNTINNTVDRMTQKLSVNKKEQEKRHKLELAERKKALAGIDPNAPIEKMATDEARQAFEKYRSETLNVLMRQWANDYIVKAADSIPALVAAIKAADEYEWILKTVGGQEILIVADDLKAANAKIQSRMGGDIAATANKIFFSCQTIAELEAERAKFEEIGEFWNNDVQGLVQQVVNQLHTKFTFELWKASEDLWKDEKVSGGSWIGPLTNIAKGIISAAKAAAPPGWGIAAGGAAANGAIDEFRLHADNYVRDKKIRLAMQHLPKDAPFRFLDEHKAAMAQRVEKVCEANTNRIMNLLAACGLAELPGWSIVSSLISGVVNGYYQSQVDKLKKKLGESSNPLETAKEVLNDLREGGLDTLEQKVAEKLAEITLQGSAAFVAKTFANFLGEAVEAATDLLADAAGKVTKKLVSMILAEIGGPCAQEVTGAAMEVLLTEIHNHANNMGLISVPVSGEQRTA